MTNLQLEKLLLELQKLKKKAQDNNTLLKSYKIKSDRLNQLLGARKDLKAQIDAEKQRIEEELLTDSDYADAQKTDKELKSEIKEKSADIREILVEMKMNALTASYDYTLDGEQIKMQVEKFVRFFINGKEQK